MTIMNIIISERSTGTHKQLIKFNKKLARELYEVSSTWFAYLRVLGGNWGDAERPRGIVRDLGGIWGDLQKWGKIWEDLEEIGWI